MCSCLLYHVEKGSHIAEGITCQLIGCAIAVSGAAAAAARAAIEACHAGACQ